MPKKAVMLVFLGTKRSWDFFWVFRKKSKKSRFLRFFRKKAYGLEDIFAQSRVIMYHAKMRKKCLKKKRKKKGFSFFETFFLKWKLDIYFCPFLKLKKKFWKQKTFHFLHLAVIFGEMERNTLYFWPIFIKNPENYQKIPENRDLRKKIWNLRFWRMIL